jgi:2-keto-4-pentenoate hydratase/2-oxohepta-3-ene-1,7-dioic acid hydratase in catechol pathway
VPLGDAGKEFDYEVELGVVIGKTAKNVSRQNALEYILGYCVAMICHAETYKPGLRNG